MAAAVVRKRREAVADVLARTPILSRHKEKRPASLQAVDLFGVPYEIRTRVIAVKEF